MDATSTKRETTLQYDDLERTLHAYTADPEVAARWRRAKFPVVRLEMSAGFQRLWSVDLAWSVGRADWQRLWAESMPLDQEVRKPVRESRKTA